MISIKGSNVAINCAVKLYIATLKHQYVATYSIVLNSAWESTRKCVACEKCTHNIQNVVSYIRYSTCNQ